MLGAGFGVASPPGERVLEHNRGTREVAAAPLAVSEILVLTGPGLGASCDGKVGRVPGLGALSMFLKLLKKCHHKQTVITNRLKIVRFNSCTNAALVIQWRYSYKYCSILGIASHNSPI